MEWSDENILLECLPADNIDRLLAVGAFVTFVLYYRGCKEDGLDIRLTKEQVKELVDYLLGLLGEKSENVS